MVRPRERGRLDANRDEQRRVRFSTGTTIVGAVKTRQEILIFTDVGIQAMRFVGAPFIYSFSPVAENVSMISPKAGVAAADSVFFMDREGSMCIAALYRGCLARFWTMCFLIYSFSRDSRYLQPQS